MNARTHFVYRAFDAQGVLLYVGCTGNPKNRYREHMSGDGDARGWFGHFVKRWQVSGPYPKKVAYAKERALIAELQPIWNGQSTGNRDGRRLIADYLSERGLEFRRNPRRSTPDLVVANEVKNRRWARGVAA